MAVNIVPFSKHIQIPIGGLGLERKICPQISDLDDFRNWMTREGILCFVQTLPVSSLKPIQANLDKAKMLKMMDQEQKPASDPVPVSKDGFLMDGHHRVYAHGASFPGALYSCYVFQCDINTLLGAARTYPGVFFKND